MAAARGNDVVIVGGGLAGLAAAAALVSSGHRARGGTIHLVEGRSKVGGRAASFEDPIAGELVDACQHVALGCCTNFLDLCRQAGVADRFRLDRTLWFIGPGTARAACRAWRRMPAPLHLVPLLGGMGHFSMAEKLDLARGIWTLARTRPQAAAAGEPAAHAWLAGIGQKPRVIELFWRPVIESAVGESLELVAVSAARKVLVDGFLAHPAAIELHVPTVPLGELFGDGIAEWLVRKGVVVETGAKVASIERSSEGGVVGVTIHGAGDPGRKIACDACVLAVPWRQAGRLVPEVVGEGSDRLAGSPITAVHLWFDRPAVDLPHAVLVGRLSQWVFCPKRDHYCQVVISASRGLEGMERRSVVDRVVEDLRETFPGVRGASLVASRVVTEPTAVLSVRPGAESLRPGPRTSIEGLFLAGDWTATGWPSTMEGAVRSGRLAVDALLRARGLPGAPLLPDLPKNPLVRLLVGD